MHNKVSVIFFPIQETTHNVISCVLLSVQKSNKSNKMILVTWPGLHLSHSQQRMDTFSAILPNRVHYDSENSHCYFNRLPE